MTGCRICLDNGNLNCLVFLDVQKAFDSVNHEILLNKMHEYFGMSGTQLKWFESYLSGSLPKSGPFIFGSKNQFL